MRWDRPNAEAILALAAVDQSRLWQSCWNRQRHAAAWSHDLRPHPREMG